MAPVDSFSTAAPPPLDRCLPGRVCLFGSLTAIDAGSRLQAIRRVDTGLPGRVQAMRLPLDSSTPGFSLHAARFASTGAGQTEPPLSRGRSSRSKARKNCFRPRLDELLRTNY